MDLDGFAALTLAEETIKENTERIYDEVLAGSVGIDCGNFNAIAPMDLSLLFRLYDEIFFEGFFAEKCPDTFRFRLSKRMTRSGGKTTFSASPQRIEIALSTTLIFQTFADVERDIEVNGVLCHDRLEAAMRVFEHEIVHAIEYLLYGASSCKRSRFRTLAENIFGHTDVTHRLVVREEVADAVYDLHVGDRVSFEYDGTRRHGFINRITKRATVMVEDAAGGFVDENGKSYLKFYIPLGMLRKEGYMG